MASFEYSDIENVVFEFYKKATTDIIIGHFFLHIDDFMEHIPRIARFWYHQLNGMKLSPERFAFIPVHRPLGIRRPHLGRWVILFHETLEQADVPVPLKEKWKSKVKVLRQSLETKLLSK